jgi:hypothetical protein
MGAGSYPVLINVLFTFVLGIVAGDERFEVTKPGRGCGMTLRRFLDSRKVYGKNNDTKHP